MKFHIYPAALASFESLKAAFTSTPILAHFDPNLESVMETDASDYLSTRILLQRHHGGLYPIAYLSLKYSATECNYKIYDKELLAIYQVF